MLPEKKVNKNDDGTDFLYSETIKTLIVRFKSLQFKMFNAYTFVFSFLLKTFLIKRV